MKLHRKPNRNLWLGFLSGLNLQMAECLSSNQTGSMCSDSSPGRCRTALQHEKSQGPPSSFCPAAGQKPKAKEQISSRPSVFGSVCICTLIQLGSSPAWYLINEPNGNVSHLDPHQHRWGDHQTVGMDVNPSLGPGKKPILSQYKMKSPAETLQSKSPSPKLWQLRVKLDGVSMNHAQISIYDHSLQL